LLIPNTTRSQRDYMKVTISNIKELPLHIVVTKLDLCLKYFVVTVRSKHRSIYKNTYAKNKQLLTNRQKRNIQIGFWSLHRCFPGQTGRSFKVRYNEHAHGICNDNKKSGYSQDVWNAVSSCGAPENTFDILDTQHKGPFLYYSIPDCYLFDSIVFDVPPQIYRLVSTALITFVECLSCCLNYIFRIVYKHEQVST
jgi:hypothetical protein